MVLARGRPNRKEGPWGHPTGRRDLDEDRVWCQPRDRALALAWLGIERRSATWHPMLSIAVSSGVLAAVVQTDDERVMPHFETTQANWVLAIVGTPSLDSRGPAAQNTRRPLIGHLAKNFALVDVQEESVSCLFAFLYST